MWTTQTRSRARFGTGKFSHDKYFETDAFSPWLFPVPSFVVVAGSVVVPAVVTATVVPAVVGSGKIEALLQDLCFCSNGALMIGSVNS